MGRVIVIEDNPIYSDFVCRLLESKGFQKHQRLHLQGCTEDICQDAGGRHGTG